MLIKNLGQIGKRIAPLVAGVLLTGVPVLGAAEVGVTDTSVKIGILVPLTGKAGATVGPGMTTGAKTIWTCLLYTSPSPRDRG